MFDLELNEGNRSLHRLVALVLELGVAEDDEGSQPRSFSRTQILLHSMAVFNQQGLEQTSVQDLLDAAHISRRTFYKYFSSKLDVLESLFALSSEVLLARFRSELHDAETREALLARFIGIYFDYQFSFGKIIGLMLEEAMRSASPLAVHRERSMVVVRDILIHELEHFAGYTPAPYYVMSLLWALEGGSLQVLNHVPSAEQDEALQQLRSEMLRLWQKALA